MICAVKYSEIQKQLIGILVIPLVLVALFIISILFLHSISSSETEMNIFIFAGTISIAFISIYLLRKKILIDAEVEFDKIGIHIRFLNSSFLYSEDQFTILIDNIESVKLYLEEEYRFYVKVVSSSPNKTMYISPDSMKDKNSFCSFWNSVNEHIEKSSKIKNNFKI